jgi:ubiquinol-cytochrome c reductase iron-sulfur subunit
MSKARDWLVALGLLVAARRRPRRGEAGVRIVRPGPPSYGAETVVIALLFLAGLLAVGFLLVYALDRLPNHTQLFGVTLGGCFLVLGIAGIVASKALVVTEEISEEYPVHEHPDEQEAIAQVVEESGSRITRKRLLIASGGFAASALGVAAIAPAVSFGPVFDMGPYYESGWTRGRRLVDDGGTPYRASDIEEGDFYTAYPEHGLKEELWSPLVLVRLPLDALDLPGTRRNWAPGGIVAYSKICTHAGCAISLYRKPTFPPLEPKPALICPCHYSTFDPATGGKVLFGPAGRALPQLPLMVDDRGYLRAGGNFSEPVGPSWWGVRMGNARNA